MADGGCGTVHQQPDTAETDGRAVRINPRLDEWGTVLSCLVRLAEVDFPLRQYPSTQCTHHKSGSENRLIG